ncbi:MFS transporter [Paenibacillus silvae]|uniref:MFS transporter n=1 Tax=Paenibacillus TaxID=44249 RepID=UPI001C1110C0|nr:MULTISPECIES: MFS transporter [Paenibacillus]MBU5356516.1 MFS transporter [Paenibacillus barcinonensis]MDM5281494.1 MFS transporter [Paenibacillus silvae]
METSLYIEKKQEFKNLLSIRDYRYLMLSQIISSLGAGVYQFALIWYMKLLTNDAVFVSFITIAQFVPLLLTSIFAGVIVDRGHTKRINMISKLVCSITLFLLVLFIFLDKIQPILLLCVAFILSVFSAFIQPATSVMIRTIVPSELMERAQSLSFTILRSLSLLSLPLAAFLFRYGAQFTFIFDATSYLLSFLFLYFIKNKHLRKSTLSDLTFKKSFLDLKEGLVFIRNHSFLRNILIYITLINFILAPISILFAFTVSNQDELALLQAGTPIGSIIGFFILNKISKIKSLTKIIIGILLSLVGSCLFTFPFGIYFGIIFSVLIGTGIAFISITTNTVIALVTPKEMLGRVSSMNMIIVLCFLPVGSFFGSVLSNFISIRYIFGLMSISLIMILLLMIFNKKLQNYDNDKLIISGNSQ